MLKKFSLKNKLSVVINSTPGTKATTFMVLTPVGSRFETDKIAGASHFVEHLMFKGTKKRPTSLDISRELESAGAQFNAFTSKNYTGYYIKIDSTKSDLALDVLADIIFNSKFEKKEIEKEKGVIIEEIKMYLENPYTAVSLLFDRLFFNKHPLGRDIAGSEKTVKNISRSELYNYYKNVYTPENLVLVVAGKVEKQLEDKIKKYFNLKITTPKNKLLVNNFEKYQLPKKINNNVSVQVKKIKQANVVIGFPGVPLNHEKRYALNILVAILGGGMSSRLFTEVREKKGLAYRINAQVEYFPDCGVVTIGAGLDARRFSEAINIIKKECKKLTEKLVTKKELKDAQSSLAGQLHLKNENSSFQAIYYALKYWFEPKITEYQEEIKQLYKVTAEDILQVAKETLNLEKMKIAVVGPFTKEQVKKIIK